MGKGKRANTYSEVDKCVIETLNSCDYEKIIELIIQNINNPNLKLQIVYRVLHMISKCYPSHALQIINKINLDLNDRSNIALFIQIYCKNNLFDNAMEIYESIPVDKRSKRFITPIYEQLALNNKSRAYNFMKEYIFGIYKMTEDDFIISYNIENIEEILAMMSDNEIKISNTIFFKSNFDCVETNIQNNICEHSGIRISKFGLRVDECDVLKENIIREYISDEKGFNEIDKLNNYLLSNIHEVLIDGNNILFFERRKVNIDSFRRLEQIYNQLENKSPLVFMHIRHKNNLKKCTYKERNEANKILSRMNIWFTPYHMNDDWFFLWAGISYNKAYLLTNDKLRDHVSKISEDNLFYNSLSRWIENNVVNYLFNKVKQIHEFDEPLKYSIKIQRNLINDKAIWHLPLIDSKWLCLNL